MDGFVKYEGTLLDQPCISSIYLISINFADFSSFLKINLVNSNEIYSLSKIKVGLTQNKNPPKNNPN